MSNIVVLCDGGARGQGVRGQVGEGAIGVVIYRNNKIIGEFARGLGKCSNNRAELEAVLHSLMLCWAADLRDPIIYSDSLVVVNQINGLWGCKNPDLLPLLVSVKEIEEVFRFRLEHVPRRSVAPADQLVNEFLDRLLK